MPVKLMTKELAKKFPPIGGTESQENPVVIANFFTPDSNWTWYSTEFDGEDLFFGLVIGLDSEGGYFSLEELETVRGPWGLPIERDLFIEPTPVSKILARERRR